MPSVAFLGFIIGQGRLEMDPGKVTAVTDWPAPTNRKQLQHFLGFANFYRRFIRNYSHIAAPLTALTSVKVAFRWTPEATAAFGALKHCFVSAPVLTQPEAICSSWSRLTHRTPGSEQFCPGAQPWTVSFTLVPSSLED